MAIRITLSSQVEYADWLGVIGKTRRRGAFFLTKLEQPTLEKRFFFTKLEQTHA
jgi:hypothetical protein